MEFIQKPIPKYVAFAAESMHADYLPVRFATEQLASKSKYYEIANQNFAYGLESLEGDFQLRDLNSALFYISQVLGYTMQQGIPEFNEYQDYPVGAVFVKDGEIYIVTKTIKGKEVPVQKYDCCGNPISTACEPVCEAPLDLTKYACKVITSCMFDPIIEALQAKDEALESLIEDLSKIKLVANPDGSFTFTNADESTVTIPAHKASVKVTNSDGSTVHGFMHLTAEKHGEPTTTLQLIGSNELNQQKGFFYNPTSKQWEVDLADLVKDGSGLQVDKNGNITVKLSDLVDNTTLNVDQAGNLRVKPEYADSLVDEATEYTDTKLTELSEKGAKVYTNAPIQGTGLKTDPLNINYNTTQFKLVDNKLTYKGDDCQLVTGGDLNKPTGSMAKLGFSCFYGTFSKTETDFVRNIPRDLNNHNVEGAYSPAITSRDQLVSDGGDFSGYQIATPNEVTQFIIEDNAVGNVPHHEIWMRVYNHGMNPNGTLMTSSSNAIGSADEQATWRGWVRVSVNPTILTKLTNAETAIQTLTPIVNQLNTTISNIRNASTASGLQILSDGSLGIKLSKRSGNLLQLEKDGLYYGIEAPADTSNLYVSSSTGDDSNKGTRTSPLKTIREAFRRNSVGTRFTIHILETDLHEWRSSWGAVSGKVFVIKPYGAKFDEVSLRNPTGSYGMYRSKEIIRPRIVFIPDQEINLGNVGTFNFATVYATNAPINSSIGFLGCTLDLRSEPVLPLHGLNNAILGYNGNCPSSIYFIGCDFFLGNHIRLVSIEASCDFQLDNIKIDSTQGTKFIKMNHKGMMNFSITGGYKGQDGQQMTGTPTGQTPLTLREGTSNSGFISFIENTDRSRIAKTHIITNANLE